MQYEKIDMGSYNLHFIKTDNFKTTTISVNFRQPIIKEEITIRKFLFQMLCNSTSKYNTNRLFEMKLEDLYSANLGFNNIKFGNIINSYIDIKFLNSKYSDNKLLTDSLEFLFEIIFSPNIENEAFDLKTFELVKERLGIIIDSEKENLEKYTINRSLELMDSNDPISYDLWGYKKDLDNITPSNLYSYYIKLLETNIIDVFIIGNVDKDEIVEIFKDKFNIKTIKKNNTKPFVSYSKSEKTIEKSEAFALSQSKISIICKLLNLSLYERRYVLPIYSLILGGGSISRLFTNVREKNSLCYSISSVSNTPNSILMIYAGIDCSNYDKVLKLIEKEIYLKNVKNEELESAKKEILASLDTLLDNTTGIINYYFGIEVFNADDIETKIKNYNKVSIKDIEKLSKKIRIAIIYLLKGDLNEEIQD